MDSDFRVKVGEFEGPLDLLLDLVEKRKFHISNISLSEVADEFIEYIENSKEFPIALSADFILIASTLLLIKSKSLLPTLDLTEEERENVDNLKDRLALYKKYRELSVNLGKMFGNFLYFARERKQKDIMFAPTPEITVSALRNALHEVLRNIPKQIEPLPQVAVRKIVSLEEMIKKLTERIESGLMASFKDFSNMGRGEKINVIISFLAMLELVKRGLIRISQERHFDDINIEREELGVPRY